MNEPELTDSEIAELREARKNFDHWRWLWRMLKRLALWIVALVSGAHALIVGVKGVSEWWSQK